MKKIMLVILLLISHSVSAKWIFVGGSDGQNSFNLYTNPTMLRRTSHIAQMWYLKDNLSTQYGYMGAQYLSSLSLGEYDCINLKFRVIAISYHSKNMADGETIHLDTNPTDWSVISPGSIGKALFDIACNFKTTT
ncbi:MAG TPA: hypothetical protein PKD88_10940 [Nitrosomonas sp.]|nr:hypothetical protein [Nitrosomonas sp.]HMW21508.1 hypothetical protein [Nitrosomonas sp.]HMW69659.1 hypothetical protein [Nitrosomonas sp.]HMY62253.1 hypothetical protein [Nitrosomonas sp.]HNA71103.1 hypothetical protein [Nitrosomonas sp.]